MTDTPEIIGPVPMEYRLSLVPLDHPELRYWSVCVSWRSSDQYAVTSMGEVLGKEGTWEPEPLNSSRTDEWKSNFRYSLEEAMERAREVLPGLHVNNMTLAEFVAKWPDYMDWKND